MSCPGVSHGNQPDALKNDDMGHSGAFGCHHLPLIFCRGLLHLPPTPGHRQVFHTLICLVWSPGRVMSVGYSLINTEWESRINTSQCVCGVPRVFREVRRRFREQDNNCSRHRWLEAHTCLGFPSCQVSCSTLESLFLGERERDSDLYLQMLQTSVLDFAVREYRLKARLRIKC